MMSSILHPSARPAPALPAAAPDALEGLNDAQRAAVEHAAEGGRTAAPLLVIAGAGSGKTHTLAHRVAHLVAGGADPQRVLLLTFSRRAALEMQQRVGRVLHQRLGLRAGSAPPALPWAGTFHAIGARLLRAHAAALGLDERYTVLDRADAEDLMGLVRHELTLSQLDRRFPLKGTCLGIYSRTVNGRAPLEAVLQDAYPWCAMWPGELRRLFAAYTAAKQEQRVLDYDDLLLYWAEAMAHPPVAAAMRARFDHVLVDEYQDTNPLQAEILLALKPDGRGLTVVGDDAQAIYGFRSATVRNILDFPARFAPPARVVMLERNYRSTQPILDASNAVIEQASERYAKRLWTDRASSCRPGLVTVADELEQARWVAERVLRQREAGIPLMQQAVLFRAAHHAAAVELEFIRRNIPFVKFGGLRFLEAAHVKDLLAILRWAHNPRARLAGFRVAQLVPGIGPASAGRLLDAMRDAADPHAALQAWQPPGAARLEWRALAGVMAQLAARPSSASASTWPADFDLAMQWYLPQLERLYDDAPARRLDIRQLGQLAGGYGTRERFLTELTLDPPDATSAESGPPARDEDYAILSTIHSAKGQEWRQVYVLNVVDGCIPADLATGRAAEIEEERRLLYVAMTRARDHLDLLVPQRFYVSQQGAGGDRHVYGGRSRFVVDEALALFDESGSMGPGEMAVPGSAPADGQGSNASAPGGAAPFDIAGRLRNAWR